MLDFSIKIWYYMYIKSKLKLLFNIFFLFFLFDRGSMLYWTVIRIFINPLEIGDFFINAK